MSAEKSVKNQLLISWAKILCDEGLINANDCSRMIDSFQKR